MSDNPVRDELAPMHEVIFDALDEAQRQRGATPVHNFTDVKVVAEALVAAGYRRTQPAAADVVARAAKIGHDTSCGCADYTEHGDEDTSYVEMMQAVADAGLLRPAADDTTPVTTAGEMGLKHLPPDTPIYADPPPSPVDDSTVERVARAICVEYGEHSIDDFDRYADLYFDLARAAVRALAGEDPQPEFLPCRCGTDATCARHSPHLVLFAAPDDWREQLDGADPVRLMETWQIRPDLTEEKP